MSTRLGELLVKRGLLTAAQLSKAAEEQNTGGGALSAVLAKLGFISETDLAACLQKEYRLSLVDPSAMNLPAEVLRLIPATLVQRHHLIPINLSGSSLTVAMSDPSNLVAINEVKFLTGYDVKIAVACVSSITAAIEEHFEQETAYDDVLTEFETEDVEVIDKSDEIDLKELEKATEDAPVVRLVNAILTNAIKRRASDVHLEPFERMFRVRLRVDGVLEEIMRPPVKLKNAITSRIKVMAALDIAERRLPQDGRIKLKLGRGQEMDFRVSVLPTLFGEKIVLRLLDKSNLQLDMTKLGFEEAALQGLQGFDLQAVRHGAGDRSHRQRQDDDAVLGVVGAQQDRFEHFHRRGSGGVQSRGHQPGADPRGDRVQLRKCFACFPASRSRHHHGRRGPRFRDCRDRHQGGTHRPSRVEHAAHERRAFDDQSSA